MKVQTLIKAIFICYILQETSATTFMASCKTDLDCSSLYNEKYFCIEKKCKHEKIFPLDIKKTLGLIMIVLVSALANAGGIGGGEIIVPVYIFLFSQTVSDSIPLSKATIFAGAFINFFMIFRYRNPIDKSKLLIDYKISSYIIPLVLAGTMIGVLLTKLLPPLLIFALLVLYISQTTWDIFFKARDLWNKENEEKNKKNGIKEKNFNGDNFDFKKNMDLDLKDIINLKKIQDCENFTYDLKNEVFLTKEKDLNNNEKEVNNMEIFKKELVKEESLSSEEEYTINQESLKTLSTKSSQEEEGSNNSFPSIKKIKFKQENKKQEEKKTTIIRLFKKNINYILIALFTYIALLAISLLRGGKGFHSLIGLNTCSMPSWSLFLVGQIFTIAISIYIFKKQRNQMEDKNQENEMKTELNIQDEIEKSQKSFKNTRLINQAENLSQKYFQSSEKKLKSQKKMNSEELLKLKKLGVLSYLTGVLAGSLGIGGGIIMNPVLLQLGYHPEIAAAISSFLVLFTSLSTSSQFLIVGAFDFNYAFVIFIFSALGSFLGNLVIMKLLRKYNRPSLIVWILFFLLLLSLLILPPVGFMKILEQKSYLTFGSPC